MKSLYLSIFLIISWCFNIVITGCAPGENKTGSFTPAVPTGIHASAGDFEDKVVLTWNAVEGADHYIVYKSVDDTSRFHVIASEITDPSYTDTPVTTGRKFYYKVASAHGNSWSTPAAEVSGFAQKGTPLPPADISIPAEEIGRITIKWLASAGADSYKILRAEKFYSGFTEIAVVESAPGAPEYTYTDTTAVPDIKYYYKITAVNPKGDGVPSDAVTATALREAPGIPGNVSASDGVFSEKIKITWTAAERASSYTILRAPNINIGEVNTPGDFIKIADNITGEIFEDRSLGEDNSIFYYKVSAVNSGGISGSSDYDSGNITLGIPPQINPPATVKASKGQTNKITISWDAVPGAVKYTIYRSIDINGEYREITNIESAETVVFEDTTTLSPFIEPVIEPVTKYYYKITAWSESADGTVRIESEKNITAAQGFALPEIPEKPVLSTTINHSPSVKKITLSWPAVLRAKTYDVYRTDDDPENTFNLISENQTATEWIDTGGASILTAKEYYYKVVARNEAGQGELSEYKGAMLLTIPPSLSASKSYKLNVTYDYTLTWTGVDGATGYEIVYDNSTTITIPGGTTTSATFNIPSGALSHQFKIRAVNSNVNIKGDFSTDITK